jgi:hypothetical protein
MTAIARRSIRASISVENLAAANDLDGVQDATKTIDVTGAQRVILVCVAGTLGTAGVDVVQISKDGGTNWAADTTLQAIGADEHTGDIVADAALEAAGVDPVTFAAAAFKSGPHNGPTLMRVARDTDGFGGTDWVTGAPSVDAIVIR